MYKLSRKVPVKILSVLIVLVFLFADLPADAVQESYYDDQEVTVAFLCDGESNLLRHQTDMVKDELVKLAADRYKADFLSVVCGDFTVSSVREKLEELFSDDEVSLIVCFGRISGGVAANMPDFPKPVILADQYDVKTSGLPFNGESTGKKNLNYLGEKGRVEEVIDTFRKLYPFKSIHVLMDPAYVPALVNFIGRQQAGLEIVVVEYKPTLQETLDALMPADEDQRSAADETTNEREKAEAVFFGFSDLFYKYGDDLITAVNKEGIPSFTGLGEHWVESGVLAGVVPRFYTKFARRVALNADRYFRGEQLEDLPVLFNPEERLIINARTARQLGVSIPFDIIFGSKVLYADEDWGEDLSMKKAVRTALDNNLLFRIKDEEIRQAGSSHLIEWSNYLPQVEYQLQYSVNDSESARNNFGIAKQNLNNRFSASQLIFSDPAITNIINSGKQVDVERLSRVSQTYDIIEETSLAYLEFLIAKAIKRVSEEDLEATQEHLRMAEVRYKSGQGAKEEALRWRSELADRQAQVISSESDVYTSRVILNQLMNHPQETPFVEQDVSVEMTKHYMQGTGVGSLVKNESMLKIFIDFMVERGLRSSPEMDALDVTIRQQKNIAGTALKRFILPEVGLDSYLDDRAYQEVYGSMPRNDHPDWYVGVTLSYPIFEGGKRVFELKKERSETSRLLFKRELLGQNIELEIRKAAYQLYYSIPNIDLSLTSMENASANYDIIQNKYSKGLSSITDLIDAQRDKFNRESDSVVAVYQFLQDLTTFDRAVSNFMLLADDEEKKQWKEDLNVYFLDRGVNIDTV